MLISSKAVSEVSCSSCISARLFFLFFLFLSLIQFVNSRCSSLMLNHHSITKRIISLTLTLTQCYFFNTLSVDYIYTGSVDLTLEVLLCMTGSSESSESLAMTGQTWDESRDHVRAGIEFGDESRHLGRIWSKCY